MGDETMESTAQIKPMGKCGLFYDKPKILHFEITLILELFKLESVFAFQKP